MINVIPTITPTTTTTTPPTTNIFNYQNYQLQNLDIDTSSTFEEDELIENYVEHDSQPIKDINTIQIVQQHLLNTQNYKTYLLFTLGINLGLRCGDLLSLKLGNFIDSNKNLKDDFLIIEQKTRNTKGKKKKLLNLDALNSFTTEEDKLNYLENTLNEYKLITEYNNTKKAKPKKVYINNDCKQAIILYLNNTTRKNLSLNSFLFVNESNNRKSDNEPMSRRNAERKLKRVINDELNIDLRAGTHMLRKTFSYHIIMSCSVIDRPRAIEKLQKILGHTSITTTLKYAGLTSEEIEETYQSLTYTSNQSTTEFDNDIININDLKFNTI